LCWAAVSVPTPDIDLQGLKESLHALSPEELRKIRMTAYELENHHRNVIEYLQQVTALIYENGYLAPVRVK